MKDFIEGHAVVRDDDDDDDCNDDVSIGSIGFFTRWGFVKGTFVCLPAG